jgi:quercetin dioxygenase-like cupin family protein
MTEQEAFPMRRLGTLPDGNTTVDTINLPWSPWARGGVSGVATRLFEGPGVLFRHLRADSGEWHAPPDKQFCIVLEGRGTIDASDGSVLELEPGSICLMDHPNSKGHFNRSLGPTGLLVAFVPLSDELL